MSDDLSLLAEKCIEISDGLADRGGFVAARNLADRFDASIVLRPLLVEGMLASIEPDAQEVCGGRKKHRWAVLLDTETYVDVTQSHIENEDSANPLPARMRNTIAHELVHSFAFRATDFGVRLTKRDDSKESWNDFIKWIEEETEKLSPFLLIPDKYLDSRFSRNKTDVSIKDLQEVMWNMGVSRYVLVNRLKLLRLMDKMDILNRRSLSNLAVGIGAWLSHNEASFKQWPLFLNFERNIVPEFLIRLFQGKQPSLDTVFTDPSFFLCGGNEFVCEMAVRGGTSQTPNSKEMRISCLVENGSRKRGEEFLFIVRSIV